MLDAGTRKGRLRFQRGQLRGPREKLTCTLAVTMQREGTCVRRWGITTLLSVCVVRAGFLEEVILTEHHLKKVSRKELTRAVGQENVHRGIT